MSSELNVTVATPERVALELPIAGVGSRAIAYIIDAAAIFVVALVAYFLYSLTNEFILKTLEDMSTFARVAAIVIVFFLMWIYWTVFEIAWNGQTLGKRLMKIRVVSNDGSPVTPFQSAVRNLLRLVDFLPTCYPVGIVTMLIDARHRRLGDIAAGTILIREQKIDLSRYDAATSTEALQLSSADLESITELLNRFDALSDDARTRLARKYAAKLGISEPETKSGEELRAILTAQLKGPPRG